MQKVNLSILQQMEHLQKYRIVKKSGDFFTCDGEPVFEALLEKKTGEVRRETVIERDRKFDGPERKTLRADIKSRKPSSEKYGENETCDIAKEAAGAQIVWVGNTEAEVLPFAGQEPGVIAKQPVMFNLNENAAQPTEETVLSQLTGDVQMNTEESTGEILLDAQTEFTLETTVELTAQATSSQAEPEIGNKTAEGTDVELNVTTGDGEEDEATEMIGAPLFDKVETAPIKVAEAPERAQESKSVEEQVNAKLTEVLETGETKVELQLEPIELGRLTIELTRGSDGALNIQISAEHAETRNLLERHVHTMQETLGERGQQNVQITVERGEESQRQDNQQRDDFRDGSNSHQNEQQQRHENRRSGEDFLQQLRLGLLPIEEEEED